MRNYLLEYYELLHIKIEFNLNKIQRWLNNRDFICNNISVTKEKKQKKDPTMKKDNNSQRIKDQSNIMFEMSQTAPHECKLIFNCNVHL